ncbi:MAG: DUF1643 domain-containing protein [Actinomycetota bacterium]
MEPTSIPDGDGAYISADGRHRLWLRRQLDPLYGGDRVLWVMCNPSTATAETDDATVRKVRGFSSRWGAGAVTIVNLWTYPATDPDDLLETQHPLNHADADDVIATIEADYVVVAWGSIATKVPGYHDRVRELWAGPLDFGSFGVYCLGTNADGSPRHPARLGYDTPLKPWTPGGAP